MTGAPVFGGRYAGVQFDADRRVVWALVEMPIRMGGPILDHLGPPPAPGEGPLVLLHWVDADAVALTGQIEQALREQLVANRPGHQPDPSIEIGGIPAAADAVLALLGLRPPPRGTEGP